MGGQVTIILTILNLDTADIGIIIWEGILDLVSDPPPILKHFGHLKSKITYHVFPLKNIMKFIKEAEYKYKLRNLSPEDKVKELIESYSFLLSIGELNLENNDDSDDGSDSF